MGNSNSLQDEIFNLRLAAKQLNRQSAKCKKAEKIDLGKIKKAIQQGNQDIARIHSENAIRNRNQSLNFLRLASRMDAIVQRLQTAESVKNLGKSMVKVSNVMKHAIKEMNVEKITKTMDKFEKNFEDLDIQSSVMEGSIQQSVGNVMPEDQVEALMHQVADEHGLEMQDEFAEARVPASKLSKEDELERRFNELKNNS